MSKKARNQRHVRAMSVPTPMASVPRSPHEHNRDSVRTNGNRIRRGCDVCGGAWTKWRPMTDAEKVAYKPAQEAKVEKQTDAQRHADHFNSAKVQTEIAKRKAMETGTPVIVAAQQPKDEPPAVHVSDLKALLMKAQEESTKLASGQALNIADQAGVTVQEEVLGSIASGDLSPMSFGYEYGDTPGKHRTGVSGTEALRPNLDRLRRINPDATKHATWPVRTYGDIIEQHPTHGDLPETIGELTGLLDDDENDHSDTVIVDDFEDEEQEYSDKRMCYIGIGGGPLHMMSEEDAYQELDAFLSDPKTKDDADYVVAEAVWDSKEGDWTIPQDVMDGYTAKYGFPDTSEAYEEIYPKDEVLILEGDVDADDTDVDDAKVKAFVSESFGGDDEPQEEYKPAWRITLDWGNDTSDTLAWDGGDYGASHLIQHLNTRKRDDLEFAARKQGIRGVTTKVKKEFLIRALVVMADTRLVKEHALNRAAVMLRTAPVKDSDTEWAQHYGG